MERTLKQVLVEYIKNFEKYGAYSINEYFNSDFGDEYDLFELDEKNIKALEYLNDEFIDIDMNFLSTVQTENKVKKVLSNALGLIN